MTTSGELRQKLSIGAEALDTKFANRLAIVEWWRPWAAGGAVFGAAVAGLSRLITNAELSIGLAVAGAIFAAACGVAIALMDYKKLEISSEAKAAFKTAEEALNELAARELELAAEHNASAQAASAATAFDRKRLARIQAIRLMIEVVEAALLKNLPVRDAATRLLQISAASLRAAIDHQSGDLFTITIFRAQTDDAGQEFMHFIARDWTDSGVSAGGRTWPKGRGYTGVLWALACVDPKASVVEPDTTTAAAQAKYPVDSPDSEREARYRSVASFPITIGKDNQVWGIVTATSSRKGVFDHTGELARQSAEVIRDVALVAGLLAKLDGRH